MALAGDIMRCRGACERLVMLVGEEEPEERCAQRIVHWRLKGVCEALLLCLWDAASSCTNPQ